MNNIAKLELPVSFDSLNDAIVDAKGRTIAIVSWPHCGLDVLTIKERASYMVERMNAQMINVRNEEPKQVNVSCDRKELRDGTFNGTFIDSAKQFLGDIFVSKEEEEVVKVRKNAVVVREYMDEKGEIVRIKGHGYVRKGLRLMNFTKVV